MEEAKKPVWFRVFAHQDSMIQATPSHALGNVLKAAMSYFRTGVIPPLTELEQVVFAQFRDSVDMAYLEYRQMVDGGKKGGRPRKAKQN